MGRKRNEEYIEAAQTAAQEILIAEGYNAASYTAIAEHTGIARTTVQHYFPAKESFATELMTRIADVAAKRAADMTPEDESNFVTYYLTSQLAYGVFYLTEGTRQFLYDICASRELQHAAAPDYMKSAFEMFSIKSATDKDMFDLQYAMGGIYEIHYLYIREGKTPDFAQLLSRIIKTLARMTGISNEECNRILEQYTIDHEELFAIGRELYAQL